MIPLYMKSYIPDIDIDFPSNRRDDIYKKIFNNWENKVARISNHIMFKEKSAMRVIFLMFLTIINNIIYNFKLTF